MGVGFSRSSGAERLVQDLTIDLVWLDPVQRREPPTLFEDSLKPRFSAGAVDSDPFDWQLDGDERSEHSAHAVSEEKDVVAVDEVELCDCLQRLLVAIQLAIEADVPQRSAFAVAATGALDAQRDVAASSEVAGDPCEDRGLSDWRVDGKARVTALEQHHCRMASCGAWARDDCAQARAVADHRAVCDVVAFAFLARHLSQRDALLEPNAVAYEVDCEDIARARLGHSVEEHRDAR